MKIENFKANFLGGIKPNKFFMEVGNLPDKTKYLFKGSMLPGVNLGEILINYQGAQIKIAGDKTFNDWNVTMLLDEDFAGYNEIEAWHLLIKNNDSGMGANNHNQYEKDCFVNILGQSGETLATYKFVGCWPKIIPDTDLNWDSSDTLVEIPITFSYDYWERVT